MVATAAVRRERRESETPAGDGRRGSSSSEDWEPEIGGGARARCASGVVASARAMADFTVGGGARDGDFS